MNYNKYIYRLPSVLTGDAVGLLVSLIQLVPSPVKPDLHLQL